MELSPAERGGMRGERMTRKQIIGLSIMFAPVVAAFVFIVVIMGWTGVGVVAGSLAFTGVVGFGAWMWARG